MELLDFLSFFFVLGLMTLIFMKGKSPVDDEEEVPHPTNPKKNSPKRPKEIVVAKRKPIKYEAADIDLQPRDAYTIRERQQGVKGADIIQRLKSKKEMVILNEILGKPKGLQ